MASTYDVPPTEIIEKAAEILKKNEKIKPPQWSAYVKTGIHKERPPVNEGWWYIRTASILLKVAKLGPIGVSKLRTKYGGKKRRGHKPSHFYKGSGNIIRKILQQLEEANLVKNVKEGKQKGRIIGPQGKSLLTRISAQIYKGMAGEKTRIVKKEEVKREEKEIKKPKEELKAEKTEVKKEKSKKEEATKTEKKEKKEGIEKTEVKKEEEIKEEKNK